MVKSVHAGINTYSHITLDGDLNTDDYAYNLTLDNSGNVYVTGTVDGNAGWVGKFDSSLILQSSVTFSGMGLGFLEGYGIQIAPDGNVVVVGIENDAVSGTNMWLGKFDPNLVLLSSTSFTSSGNHPDLAQDLAIDTSGNIYVSGNVFNPATLSDLWVGKFNSSLVLQSSVTINGTADNNDFIGNLKLDGTGKLYVVGDIRNSDLGDIWVGKFDTSPLTLLATTTVSGTAAGSSDFGYDVTIDRAGRILVVGDLQQTGIDCALWLGRYNSSLVLQSSTTFSNGPGTCDLGLGVTTDESGNIYVSGTTDNLNPTGNMWLGQFNSSLVLQSSLSINGSANDNTERGYGVVFDGHSNLYMAGVIRETSGGKNIWLSKHSIASALSSSSVEQIRSYPNPLILSEHPAMTFDRLPAGARIRIYTLTGALVKELHADDSGQATWTAVNESSQKVASGVYYVFVEGNGQKKTTKVAIER